MKRHLFLFVILTLAFGLFTISAYANGVLNPSIPPSPNLGTWTFSTAGTWHDFNINVVGNGWVENIQYTYIVTAPGDPGNLREFWIESPAGTQVLIGYHADETFQGYNGDIWDFYNNGEYINGNWKVWVEDPWGGGNIKVEVICTFFFYDGPVPVELSSFTAAIIADNVVELNWVSETETNMMGYRVYRSTESNRVAAEEITYNIIPAHNTSVTTRYSYQDEYVTAGNTYYYWLEGIDLDLTNGFHGPISVTIEEQDEIPNPLYVNSLGQNFPNPVPFSNPETTIKYSLRETVETMSITIYNVRGQLVRTLVPNGPHDKGEFQVVWDGRNDVGKAVTSGVYFYRMTTPNFDQIEKMILVR